MICASVYLLVFIQNLLVHLAEKILLMQPLTVGGDYPIEQNLDGPTELDRRIREHRRATVRKFVSELTLLAG